MTETCVATVEMPERGVFLVRCPASFPRCDGVCGRRVVVSLDYGLDIGMLSAVDVYDPALHGLRIPGFRLERFVQPADEAMLMENDELAGRMKDVFIKEAAAEAADVRVCSQRLSFGRGRLFLNLATDRRRKDFARAADEVARKFGVQVNVRQLGPRDEVADVGALGVCGRVCCCASWQRRFPSRVAAPAGVSQAGANGVCGRYKCCFCFEQISDMT